MKTVGALKRAKHNRSCVARGSIMPGIWYPFRYWRTSANESMSIDFSVVWKTLAAIAPIMGRFKLRVGMYYCPRRLYHRDPARNARKFDIRKLEPWEMNAALDELNVDQYVEPGSLLDWLGLPTFSYGPISGDGGEIQVANINLEPLLCYLDIWRNFLSASTWDVIPTMVYRNGDNVNGVTRISALRYQDLSLDALDTLFEDILGSSSSVFPELAETKVTDFYAKVLNSTAELYTQSLWDTLRRAGSGFMPARVSSDRISRLAGAQLSPDVQVQVDYQTDPTGRPIPKGQFSITSAALAADLKRYYDTTLASGSRYSEWLKGHYDVQIRDIDRPIELDMFSFDVSFSDVVSVSESPNASTQQQTLGGMASLSRGDGNSGRNSRRYFSPEDGYLMCMVALVPEVSYLEGVQPELLQTSATDTFIPEFNGLGMQTFDPRIAFAGQFNGQKLLSTGFDLAFGGLDPDKYDLEKVAITGRDFGYSSSSIYGYEPPYMDYTSSLDSLHGDFAGSLSYWSLIRSFIGGLSDSALGQSAIKDLPRFMGLAPYAVPWQYLKQFTDTVPTSTPFQIQMGFSYISRSLVSKHQSLTL